MKIMLYLVAAGLIAASICPVQAEEWCGFLDQAHSRVRCGFSNIQDCKAALGKKKDAVCMPSPSFAKMMQGRSGNG